MKTKVAILLFLCLSSSLAKSQNAENKDSIQNFSLSLDVVSNYIWRGLALSDVPNVQPNISYTTTNGVFTVGAFGSYALSKYYSEVDLFASLSLGKFSFEVWDYFTMSDGMTNNRYFNYKNDSTGHALEGSIIFNGTESFPIKLTAATFFYGNDKKQKLDGSNENYYSTYFEIAYPFKWRSNNLTAFVGGTPAEGLYAPGFAIHNIGITNEREIKVNNNFSIPIKGTIIVNPQLENIYFVLTISLEANK